MSVIKDICNYFLNKEWCLKIVMKFISKEKQHKIRIARLRSEFMFWGYNLSDMSDEEIEQGILRISSAIRNCGVTINDFIDGIRYLSQISQIKGGF